MKQCEVCVHTDTSASIYYTLALPVTNRFNCHYIADVQSSDIQTDLRCFEKALVEQIRNPDVEGKTLDKIDALDCTLLLDDAYRLLV